MGDASVVRQEVNALVTETKQRVGFVVKGTGLLWAVELVDQLVFSGGLDRFGVHPHSLMGLLGVFGAPFLHANWAHLIGNTLGFIPLGFLASSRKISDVWVVSVIGTLTAGLGAWLFGAGDSVHIGFSGVIFAYLGFLMGRGLFERSVGAVLLSLFVTFTFGGMLWGVVPIIAGVNVSWQSHLFGFIGGVLVSKVLGEALRQRRR